MPSRLGHRMLVLFAILPHCLVIQKGKDLAISLLPQLWWFLDIQDLTAKAVAAASVCVCVPLPRHSQSVPRTCR